MKEKNDFFMSDDVKENIKSRFEQLNGIYTKVLDKNGDVVSYLARCKCKDNDYVTVVHYIVENNNDKNKYIAMAECIEKGDRYIKFLKKSNKYPLPTEKYVCSFTEKAKRFFESELYKNHIKKYENKFIARIEKYYKEKKNILLFYI